MSAPDIIAALRRNEATDWIEWAGGEQPVSDRAQVEAKLRNGDCFEGLAGQFMRGRWEHSSLISREGHIIAYRVVSA